MQAGHTDSHLRATDLASNACERPHAHLLVGRHASQTLKNARRRGLHIIRFRLKPKAHSLRRSSSPYQIFDLSGPLFSVHCVLPEAPCREPMIFARSLCSNHPREATLPLRWLMPATPLWVCRMGTSCDPACPVRQVFSETVFTMPGKRHKLYSETNRYL